MGTRVLLEAASVALQSVLHHKLRTFLTLLGIIIGVASVVVVGASIEGLNTYVTDSVSRTLGSDSFILSKFPAFGDFSEEEWRTMSRRHRDLRLDDLSFVKERCRDCMELAAEVSGLRTIYAGAQESHDAQVQGTTANILALGSQAVEDGRFFTEIEVWKSRMVCVIGWDVKDRLFPNRDAIGQIVKLRNHPFQVIGVLEKLGSSFGMSLDNVLYIPISSYQKLFGTRSSITIRGRAVSREAFEPALDQVRVAMRIRHHLRPGEDDTFGLVSTEDINETVDEFTGQIAMVVVPITLISLLVGGIVIMNIMLVAVTERTFEVGLRKAVGARRQDILLQFLIEATLLSALGGAIGLATASLLAWIIQKTTPVTMTVSLFYVVLSVGVSASIGIIFGVYPALKASRLDPIVAISSER